MEKTEKFRIGRHSKKKRPQIYTPPAPHARRKLKTSEQFFIWENDFDSLSPTPQTAGLSPYTTHLCDDRGTSYRNDPKFSGR